MLTRPQAGEYAEHFAVYIDKVPEGDLLELLQTQPALAKEEWGSLTEEQGNYRYAFYCHSTYCRSYEVSTIRTNC